MRVVIFTIFCLFSFASDFSELVKNKTQSISLYLDSYKSWGKRKELQGQVIEYLKSQPLEKIPSNVKTALIQTLQFIEFFDKEELSEEVFDYFVDKSRYKLVYDNISKYDNKKRVIQIISELYNHDKKGAQKYDKLVVALALVWDKPPTRLHNLQGRRRGILPPERDIARYFDYFKKLFKSKGKMKYEKHLVYTLVITVSVPVPIRELEWALKEVKKSAKAWGKNYKDIEYNYSRLYNGQFRWSLGEYTLANIRKYGGLGEDKAYFCVISARANGMPALFFAGQRRYGALPHAWFGYSTDGKKWDLDIGRYALDRSIKGYARNPQTYKWFTDYELNSRFNSKFRSPKISLLLDKFNQAKTLYEIGYKEEAVAAVETVVKANPYCYEPWVWLVAQAKKDKHSKKVLDYLGTQMRYFSKYVDIYVDVIQQKIDYLRILKKDKEVQRLESVLRKKVRSRDDLKAKFLIAKVKKLYEENNRSKGLKTLEQYLVKNSKDGMELWSEIRYYINITNKYSQQKEAYNFLRKWVSKQPNESLQRLLQRARNNYESAKKN